MQILETLFWISIFVVFYAYIGYGMILWVFIKIKSLFKDSNNVTIISYHPKLTLIIPAFNEEDFIRQKIKNTLLLDYPESNLEIIFITDGSSDLTPTIIKEYPRFKLMHKHERRGKIAAMNRAMKEVITPYVVFCDANTTLNASSLKEIVKHYNDPQVGGVAGEKKVLRSDSGDNSTNSESFYWKYESTLKKLDSNFFTVVGAAGELFSFRTELFEELKEDTLLDDFIISLKICQKGYRVIYEPKAYATEYPSANIKEEKKRKIRISAGAFQSFFRLISLLNFFKYPKLTFQYVSHRVLRWMVCPFLLPIILILNIIIYLINENELYKIILICQVVFYLLAFLGWVLTKINRKAGVFNIPYYFLFMNLSLYLGLARYIKGNQTVVWEKAKRKL